MKKGRLSKLILIFGLGWLLSFVGGCSAKLSYEFFNAPAWMNSVIVGLFVGLACIFMSLAAIASSFNFDWHGSKSENKIKAIYSLVLGTVIFLAGLFVFWRVFLNFQSLFL